jgi:hypothetical protein
LLVAAKDWGCPPWDILDHPDGLEWFWRWSDYQTEINRAQKKQHG